MNKDDEIMRLKMCVATLARDLAEKEGFHYMPELRRLREDNDRLRQEVWKAREERDKLKQELRSWQGTHCDSIAVNPDKPTRRILLLAICRNACAYCDKPLDLETLTIDHVIPRSKGGKGRLTNLVACCWPCNKAKGDKMPTGHQSQRAAFLHAQHARSRFKRAGVKIIKAPILPLVSVDNAFRN